MMKYKLSIGGTTTYHDRIDELRSLVYEAGFANVELSVRSVFGWTLVSSENSCQSEYWDVLPPHGVQALLQDEG